MFRYILIVICLCLLPGAYAQETFPVNGAANPDKAHYAFTHATIYVDYETIISDATLLIKEGKVVNAGKNINIPDDAIVVDLQGKYIYPSFIDLYSNYGLPKVKKGKRARDTPRPMRSTKGPFHWNQAIHPETNPAEMFQVNSKMADSLRQMGFGVVLTHKIDGIARGAGSVVLLGKGLENDQLIKARAAALYSFSKGSSSQDYPRALMGSIALLRQTYLDAEWYARQPEHPTANLSLEALNRDRDLPQIFAVRSHLSALRADKIGDEFGINYIIVGSGDEYQRVEALKQAGNTFILPIKFPKPFDVEDPFDAEVVSLEQLKHWELAPSNPYILDTAGIEFALTSHSAGKPAQFWKSLRKIQAHGLSDTATLKALTYTPAKLLGMEDQIGALREGHIANFFIASGPLFSKNTRMLENWVKGKPYRITDPSLPDLRGTYDLNIDSKVYSLEVTGEPGKLKARSDQAKGTVAREGQIVTLSLTLKDENYTGTVRLSGRINEKSGYWLGKGQTPTGEWIDWNAILKSPYKAPVKNLTKDLDSVNIWFPQMAYGNVERPQAKNTLFKGATVWTNGPNGILKEVDVMIRDGKIIRIGTGLEATDDDEVIEAKGLHLTSGIIDEHSHIGISKGVNEGTQASSAEVRIGDVVNPDDINIYRQLSGGVTVSQLLHGSSNPIGGQSALIKLRWGATPEEMKIDGAAGFIKFALGENVKQSNWGDKFTQRFPQTRMGVEQVYFDHFIRAREYGKAWEEYSGLKKKEKEQSLAPRRDLELEALLEVIESQRFITCHSYVQSEINMLMKVADSMGFRVNTFTHVLEGYKIADKLAKHQAGASTFSDWWAYKFEVNDAIPYNAALLTEMQVLTALNSDDAEMGRRLNQEAAKAVKYGGVSEEEAWKMVTLNPAKMLHLDDRMGSVEVGKDADLVLWRDNPLSIYAQVERTYIDGICYYDKSKIREKEAANTAERLRIIEKMIKAKQAGESTQKPKGKKKRLYHCDTLEDEEEHEH